jgi:hypothetical protein
MNEITKYEKQGLEVLGDTKEMESRLQLNSERLNLVHDFILENFVEGIDYGPADPRNPKPTLLKPGAEKLCKLFNTRPRWKMDEETFKMLGSPAGTICFICEIIDNTTGEVIGEGRGCEKVGNKSRDANKACKNAEKCSLVDCALYTFGLSEKFTQDMAPSKNKLEDAKQELIAEVSDLRTGCGSSMTALKFLHVVSKQFLNDDGPRSIGAVKALRKAVIEDGLFDLATGERIPE